MRVVDGPFANFNGIVDEVMPEKGKVRVLVSIFGRSTPVELDFVQVNRHLERWANGYTMQESRTGWQKRL